MIGDHPHAHVYILASKPLGTLYIGVTNDLMRRVVEHREGRVPGFTARYGVRLLVYFEEFESFAAALEREKALKQWLRAWKIRLIERTNPLWDDLGVTSLGLTKIAERPRRSPVAVSN